MKHIPAKVKKGNPLELLKAKEKTKGKKVEKDKARKLQGVGEVLPLPKDELAPPKLPTSKPSIPLPKEREVVVIDCNTPIITPAICKPRPDMKAQARIRMGVPVHEWVSSHMAEAEQDPNTFLQLKVTDRHNYVSHNTISIAKYPTLKPDRCNMAEDIVIAIIGMMERFDFTYAPLTKARDIIDSATSLTCLNAIDIMEGEDVVSHAFCLVYQMFLIRLSRSKALEMLKNSNHQVRALAAIYLRYTTPPARLVQDLKWVINCPQSVCISDEETELTMPLSEFIERLLKPNANPDFLDTVFPPFSPEEVLYVNSMVTRYREEARQRAERNKDVPHEEKPKMTDLERKIHRKAKKRQAEKEAKEAAREFKVKHGKFATLLHGFGDAGTQMSWVAYRAYMNNETAEATEAELQKKRLEIQKELFEREMKQAEEESKRPKEISEIEITQGVKDKAPLSKRAAKRAAKEEREQVQARKKAKTKDKSKLQKVADSYLDF
eukprot:TRINITY_DN18003_c0_g1_i1.p1 TRINITY_DN18003_c0_g1~~TRINITY_DN18003_c0_g1_i1.p1  ORF type:complete len:506 (+),score=223.66 TRINITY_DN18003_c0_g1_i1:40-1518(+)